MSFNSFNNTTRDHPHHRDNKYLPKTITTTTKTTNGHESASDSDDSNESFANLYNNRRARHPKNRRQDNKTQSISQSSNESDVDNQDKTDRATMCNTRPLTIAAETQDTGTNCNSSFDSATTIKHQDIKSIPTSPRSPLQKDETTDEENNDDPSDNDDGASNAEINTQDNKYQDNRDNNQGDNKQDNNKDNNHDTQKEHDNHQENQDMEPDTIITANLNTNSADEWKALFDKIRYRRPRATATPELNATTDNTVQPLILPRTGNSPVGDPISRTNDANIFRVYFQNINGLNAGKGTGKWDEIISSANERGVSILGLAETNTEWSNHRLTSRLKARLRKLSNHSNLSTSTSAIRVQSYYKPGGTATVALQHWSGRVIEQIHDTSGQGRWSGFKIRANKPIVVITAYRVPQTSIDSVGYKTAYAQQWAVARMAGVKDPEPRENTITDLIKEIKQWQKTQDVILMIDANEQIDTNASSIAKLAIECSLIDIIATRHQQAHNTATYTRGTKRIDYILVNETLARAVTDCGILAFFDGIHSDHRGSFIDLDTRCIFSDRTPILYSQPMRQLCSKKPKSVKAYKEELWKQMSAHNIQNKSASISNNATQDDTFNQKFAKELNNIANTMQQAMIRAESMCTKSPAAPYSEKMANLNKIIRYWKTKKSAMKTKRDASYQLQQIRQSLPAAAQAKTVKQFSIQTHIRKAVKEYNNELPNAKQHRQNQIYEWAEAAAKRGDKTAAQHFRSMAYAEDSKETFRILQNITKPQDKSGLKKLDIPATNEAGKQLVDNDGNTIMHTVADPREVEELLIARNKDHFSQAHGTPFSEQPLIDIFGTDGEGQATDELLQGKLPGAINTLPLTVQAILRKIAAKPTGEFASAAIDTDQLTTMYKRWKERTSTSPSGCHLGHWHALFAADGTAYPKDGSIQDVGPKIMEAHANILNASTTSGVPLDRWIKVHSQMIAKSEGQPRIDKLRVIHLYEADYNGFLKTTWPHRAVHLATKNKTLNHAQGGGQKGRQANHIALQKEMKYQYARLRKSNFATMDNDAKACYDRIIMLLATIVSGHFGVPKQARDLQARAIRKMQFHVKTALGISDEYYTDSTTSPLHGSGQGSGSSAPIWLFISSIIMDCFEDVATGMDMANMDATTQIKQWIDGFVDDTSIFTNHDSNNTDDPNTLAHALQNDARAWNALLSATGGKLELSKCFFYILHWTFDEEGTPNPMTKTELEAKGVSISIHETDRDSATTITHLDCTTAHRTLGLYKSPTGNQSEQLKKIQEKSTKISESIALSTITRSQANIAWNAIYIPAIAYPLVATYMTEDTLTKIENKALVNFLPKMGYNRNTARAVIYGPEEMGGVGIKNLYVEQSIEQIKAFTQHTRMKSPLGQTIQINLDWVQLIAGIHCPVLENTRKLHHIEGEWFTSIRDFLRSINGQIKQTSGWRPQLERTNDHCLMDILTTASKTDMVRINRCRIFLQATTISDITNADGTRITDYAWTPQQHIAITNPRRSKHAWPRQPRPGPKAWKAWKAAIQRHLSKKGRGQNLSKPLGPWTVSPTKSRQHWEWYIDHTTQRIIRNTPTAVTAYPLINDGATRQQHDTERPEHLNEIPETAIPTAVGMDYSTRHKANQVRTDTTVARISTFQEYMMHLDPWEKRLFQDNANIDHKIITDKINTNSRIIIVSDGGMADGYGSFGWAIAVDHNSILGKGEAEGQRNLMQSFRAEGYGMLAALRFILHACKFEKSWPRDNKAIHTYCDNLALIQRIKWHGKRTTITPKNVSAPDYDIESSITMTMDQLAEHKIFIKPTHVKGHQDKFKQYHQLSKEAQLNVDADGEATAALQNHSKTEDYHMPESAKTMLYIAGKPVTSNEAKTIRNTYLSKNLRQHMITREHWNDTVPDTICWEAHRRSLNKLDKTDKTRIHKFLHRCLPTNKKMHDINDDHPAKCPACNGIETNDHVTACSNPRRVQLRKELCKNTRKAMDKQDTHQHIKECILIGLQKAVNNDATPIQLTDLSFTPTEAILRALEEQHAIGWTNFYRGRISKKWLKAQQEHATSNTNQASQDTIQWASKIITTMWYGFLQLWKERKQDQHGRDSTQQQEYLRRNLLKQVNNLHANLHTYDTEDKRYFSKPVTDWEQASNKDIQDWLAIAEPLAERSASRARNRISRDQPEITRFFRADTTRETIKRHARTHNRRPPRQQYRAG